VRGRRSVDGSDGAGGAHVGRGRGVTAFLIVHAATQAERIVVVPCCGAAGSCRGGVGGGSRARAPKAGRGWRWRGAIVVVHASSEAEGVVGIVVRQWVLGTQRFVPQIVEVVWQGKGLGRRSAAT